jgi:hypothetical protein
MQPGAGGTNSHQTEADAIACSLNASRDERAGNDGRRAGAILARPPCQFPSVGPGGLTQLSIQFAFLFQPHKQVAFAHILIRQQCAVSLVA